MTHFKYVVDKTGLDEGLNILAESNCLACDTETYALPKYGSKGSALDPHTGRISLLILKGRDTPPVVFDILHLAAAQVNLEPLHQLVKKKNYLLFHNARFDLKFFLSTFGYMPEKVRDTMIMAKLVSNATGSKAGQVLGHGYADLCRDYLNLHITGKKEQRESTWYCGLDSRNLDNEWWAGKVLYAANDVQHLFALEDILLTILLSPLPDSPLTHSGLSAGSAWGLNMAEVFQREMQYIPVLARREYVGLPVSLPMLKALHIAAQKELDEVICYLSKAFQLDPPVYNVWLDEEVPSEKAKSILRSNEGLRKCLSKALKLGTLDNVQSNVLSRLLEILDALSIEADEEAKGGSEVFIDGNEELMYHELLEIEMGDLIKSSEVMRKVLTFKRLSKQVGTDLRNYINPVTGRIHTGLNQLGTATGRISSVRPNCQQISARTTIEIELKDKDLFRCTSQC